MKKKNQQNKHNKYPMKKTVKKPIHNWQKEFMIEISILFEEILDLRKITFKNEEEKRNYILKKVLVILTNNKKNNNLKTKE